ncbi:MAG: tryptophan synthase subunit alpha [Chloroflexi bacterium]|nr:tryptophan synthase subunit alpha [Chloroflexota bacterium]
MVATIADTFRRAAQARRTALIPYVTVGFPELNCTPGLIATLAAYGADLIELGVPFSDPTADGPVIQHSGQVALRAGVTLEHCLAAAAASRKLTDVPLVLMGYYNPFLQFGWDRLMSRAAAAGVVGFIVPDLPPEEGVEFSEQAAAKGLDVVFMAAPTSSDQRLNLVGRKSRGFVYCVTVKGVTGQRRELSPELPAFLARVRCFTKLPLAAGFGISSAGHVQEVGRYVDGAVVGSALMAALDGTTGDVTLEVAASFIGELSKGAVRSDPLGAS